jgi:hypothetical protein
VATAPSWSSSSSSAAAVAVALAAPRMNTASSANRRLAWSFIATPGFSCTTSDLGHLDLLMHSMTCMQAVTAARYIQTLDVHGNTYDGAMTLQGARVGRARLPGDIYSRLHLAHVHNTVQCQTVYGPSCIVASARTCAQTGNAERARWMARQLVLCLKKCALSNLAFPTPMTLAWSLVGADTQCSSRYCTSTRMFSDSPVGCNLQDGVSTAVVYSEEFASRPTSTDL